MFPFMTTKTSDDSAPDEASIDRKRQGRGIAAVAQDERPRERLLARGPLCVLTDAELLAIVLRIGVEGKNAIELGRELLHRFGSLQAMISVPLSAWDDIKDGNVKKAQLVAAMMDAGVALPTTREETYLKSTTQAADYFAARLRGWPRNTFAWPISTAKAVGPDDSLIAKGTVNTVHPPMRSIVARALQTNASVLIAAHNHPSGVAEPSAADKELTRDLIAACHPRALLC